MMNELHKILTQITNLTTNIKVNYPELYRSLNENPVTIPNDKHLDINIDIMKEYLESLKELLKHYIESHKK